MALSQGRKDEVVHLCKSLVQIPSLSGEEGKVAAYIEQFAQANGFDEVHIDHLGNVTVVKNGKHPGPTILFDGHIDTVPIISENWTYDPYGAVVEEGKIYGRGTSDMKGAVSAMLLASKYFAEDYPDFHGKVVVSCSVHEECFEGIAPRQVSTQYNPDFAIIGEASNLQLNIGQRGRAEVVLEVFGKSVHSSNPAKGINAVNKAVKLISAINALPRGEHSILGEGILELTDIISAPYPGASVVPSYARVTFDRRLLVGETRESVLAPIERIIETMKKEDPELDANISYSSGSEKCYTGQIIEAERFFPAWLFDAEAEFIQDALAELKKELPDTALSHYSFCTNGSHFAGEKGIPTIGFGPSYEHLAHIDDEYIEIEQLYQATIGYVQIMKALTKSKVKGAVEHV